MTSNILGLFAATADSSPPVHITPGEVLNIGGFAISNSMLYAWISSVFIIVILISLARRVTIRPKGGFIQLIEIGSGFINNLLESSLGSREKALKYSPYFVTTFFFIVLSNWLGLLPGVGEALKVGDTPLFRPFTADLNGTLAAASVTMVMVQYFAIKESGFVAHIGHYFNGSLKNPVTILMGLFEVFSEFTRVASLALRLFLNVAIGEIIIGVFSFLGKAGAPITSLPFVVLELFVGALQAYIFVMLSIMYLAVAVKHGAENKEHDAVDHDPLPLKHATQGEHG